MHVAPEGRRGRERECRLVEHVGLDGAGHEAAPIVQDRREGRERTPFDLQQGFHRRVHGSVFRPPQTKT